MKITTIRQTIYLPATPVQVYRAMINEDEFSSWSGLPATIIYLQGGWFMVFRKDVSGYQLKLREGECIIQAWTHKDFPEAHFSIADIQLEESPKGTKLVLRHYAVPSEAVAWLRDYWRTKYWRGLRRYFRKGAVSIGSNAPSQLNDDAPHGKS